MVLDMVGDHGGLGASTRRRPTVGHMPDWCTASPSAPSPSPPASPQPGVPLQPHPPNPRDAFTKALGAIRPTRGGGATPRVLGRQLPLPPPPPPPPQGPSANS